MLLYNQLVTYLVSFSQICPKVIQIPDLVNFILAWKYSCKSRSAYLTVKKNSLEKVFSYSASEVTASTPSSLQHHGGGSVFCSAFSPSTTEQEDVATSVALGFCASSIYGCPGAAQQAGSSRPCTAAADAIFFQNEGFEIAAYEEKVRFKRPPYKAEVLDWFYEGSNNCLPKKVLCFKTLSAQAQIILVLYEQGFPAFLTLHTTDTACHPPSVGNCLSHPSLSSPGSILHH